MPINPFVDYQAPSIYLHGMDNLAAGVNQFGSGLFDQYQKEKEKRQKEQREKAYDDQIMQFAIQQDAQAQKTNQPRLLTDEQIHDYQMGSRKDQQQITHGIVHGFIDKMTLLQNQQAFQQKQRQAQLDQALSEKALARFGQPVFGEPTQTGTTEQGQPIMRPQQIGEYGLSGPSYYPQRAFPQPPMTTQNVPGIGQVVQNVPKGTRFFTDKQPQLSDPEKRLLAWATGRMSAPVDVAKDLPADLAAKITKKGYDKMTPEAWTWIKQQIIKRYTTPNKGALEETDTANNE